MSPVDACATMAKYRRLLVVVALVGLSAGCVGFLTGTQALEFSANRTVASDAALQQTGYQEANNQTVTNVVNIGAAGQERQVNLTSYLYVYNRTVDANDLNESQLAALGGGPDTTRLPEGGARTPPGETSGDSTDVPLGNASGLVTFSVLAMPNARVGGQSVHPLSRVSSERLVRRFLARGNTSVRFVGNHTVESLDGERTVSTFRVEGGQGPGVVVHVATFDAGNDYVVAFGVHPGVIDERDRIDTLLAGLDQPFV